ncbi:hypothetical protein AGABI1DRAFT_93830 [Agaricus bisporus var. burnettii JB137-S8]|uniref:Nephrocystin 3-like N-terminal domain-containing protein n=1 Tax=Agaricus bisporus var. burnettii (strain JB137-S8 / ATCC MYA-4627 / FGSC 10392) TaxID=597362 RepID=K5X1W8_AGABU|nr:uncharacterized protein AGABI1DRAFT_93830 [Agaricus bisporus var. burnettii JB137-S8]EKM76912.1 hypothetical protein AGABI1DRAFT_93830 [Agaricus bisporus var. burnettii JB137-S8]
MDVSISAGSRASEEERPMMVQDRDQMANACLAVPITHQRVKQGFELSLQLLLGSTIPQAAYDSSARQHAPSCHPNTREQYIKDITSWVHAHNVALPGEEQGSNQDGIHLSSLLWVNGAAGVGKSAVAQTCAVTLQKTLELGAAFFISSPNRHNDPDKFFTSIAYQLATRLRPATSLYGSVLEEVVRRDPSILTKSPAVQFRELIAAPLLDILSGQSQEGVPVSDAPLQRHQRAVIIIDGLDECARIEAQCEILRIISQATLDYPDLPLVWAVFSRPEPHIELTIKRFAPLWWNVSLPISQSTYKDIEIYLIDNFARIQKQYQLTSPGYAVDDWPSEKQIKTLTDRSAGLFIYAATIVRFFDDPRLSYTRNILFILANELYTGSLTVNRISNLLGYSISTTLSVINSLRSVLVLENEIGSSDGKSSQHQPQKEVKIAAYHYSFIEYLRTPQRSGQFCVFDDECRVFWSQRCLQIISEFNTDDVEAITLSHWISSDLEDEEAAKSDKLQTQKDLLIEASCSLLGSYAQIPNLHNYSNLINPLLTLDFRKIAIAAGINVRHLVMSLKEDELKYLMEQV